MRNVVKLLVAGLLATASLIGCSTEQETNSPPGNWQVETQPIANAVDDGKVEPGDVETQAGCSYVEYCNAPGSDGSRCRQQGCSVSAAQSECESETRSTCGTPSCPWIFVGLDGTRYYNSPCP